ncbi:MAG: YabP/YqfC family sporulation protein [Clostridia bacterium]|nr:YabP/YqfC family sporulation protein [Clostridia bacterium]
MARKLKIEKGKSRPKWNISGKEAPAFEGEMITGPHTEIFGNSRINIEGCLGVFEYKDTYLKLRLSKGSLILCGSGFDIVYYENRLITVRGKISSVEFCV